MVFELLSPVCPPTPKTLHNGEIEGRWVLTHCEQMLIPILGQKYIVHREITAKDGYGRSSAVITTQYYTNDIYLNKSCRSTETSGKRTWMSWGVLSLSSTTTLVNALFGPLSPYEEDGTNSSPSLKVDYSFTFVSSPVVASMMNTSPWWNAVGRKRKSCGYVTR